MPTVAQIENADVLIASQATRLIRAIRASEVYNEDRARWPGVEAKVFGRVGRRKTITGASNAAPIVITSVGHGFTAEDLVTVQGVGGNTAANGVWIVANPADDTFELFGSIGNGAYTSGGEILDLVSQHLSAIVDALDQIGDGTVGIKGGRDGTDYSQTRDREALIGEALAALFTSAEDAASGAYAVGQRTFGRCCPLCGWVSCRCATSGIWQGGPCQ
jgi:hypothetical protein